MRKIQLAALLFLTLLLTACGFKMQGEKQLAPPLSRLYLQTSDPYGTLARNLKEILKTSNVQMVSSPQEADTILVISSDVATQDFLSVGATQQTRQYNLKVTVTFQITDAHGAELTPSESLAESRAITIQSNDILGSSNEANLYYQQMRRALAYAIMNRIASREITQLVISTYHHDKIGTNKQ